MAEYTKGNRFRRTGRPKGMPRLRWFGSVMLSFLTKVASGYWHVFDPQCGFTAITGPTLARLKLDGLARDYFFENDMLIRLNVIDARVVDVATSTRYSDKSLDAEDRPRRLELPVPAAARVRVAVRQAPRGQRLRARGACSRSPDRAVPVRRRLRPVPLDRVSRDRPGRPRPAR